MIINANLRKPFDYHEKDIVTRAKWLFLLYNAFLTETLESSNFYKNQLFTIQFDFLSSKLYTDGIYVLK